MKVVGKLKIQGKVLNLIKCIYEKPICNTIPVLNFVSVKYWTVNILGFA